jgi:hypothetical protein
VPVEYTPNQRKMFRRLRNGGQFEKLAMAKALVDNGLSWDQRAHHAVPATARQPKRPRSPEPSAPAKGAAVDEERIREIARSEAEAIALRLQQAMGAPTRPSAPRPVQWNPQDQAQYPTPCNPWTAPTPSGWDVRVRQWHWQTSSGISNGSNPGSWSAEEHHYLLTFHTRFLALYGYLPPCDMWGTSQRPEIDGRWRQQGENWVFDRFPPPPPPVMPLHPNRDPYSHYSVCDPNYQANPWDRNHQGQAPNGPGRIRRVIIEQW